MKTHTRNLAVGGLIVPLTLALATLIANEAQTLLGLHLERIALAIYLLPFLAGGAAVVAAMLRLEAAKIGGELGDVLGDLASSLFGTGAEDGPQPAPAPAPAIVPSATGAGPPAPPALEPPPAPPSTPPAR